MLINGVPSVTLSCADRGLAYGDGIFETIRFQNGKLLYEDLHLQRLARGCERLALQLDIAVVRADLAAALRTAPEAGVLKLIVTRAEGGRGYRPASKAANRILSLHPLPDYSPHQPEAGIHAFVCKLRMAAQPALAGIKHLNRLEQVLASSEWPDNSSLEGLMLDQDDRVIEGTRSNLFLAKAGRLHTPALGRCGIEGIMRQVLLQEFSAEASVGDYTLADLRSADEVFFCNSVFGVWPLLALQAGDEQLRWTAGPFAGRAQALFKATLSL